MQIKKKPIQIIALFILLSGAILFRASIENTHYCSPDSRQYLEVASNYLKGLGFVGPDVSIYSNTQKPMSVNWGHPESYSKQYFAVWPLAYPCGIILTAQLTHLDVLWASKVFNLFLLGIDFWLLYLLLGKYSTTSIFYFGSFTMLEICSYTWSENLFIPLFLIFIIALKKIHSSANISISALILFAISLLGMCLTRYASVIYIFISATIMGYYLFKKDLNKAKTIFIGLSFSSGCFIAYLMVNYIQTGYFTGIPRSDTQVFGWETLLAKFWMGIFNQLHFIKPFSFNGTVDFIFYLMLTLAQIALIIYLIRIFKENRYAFKFDELSQQLVLFGLAYILFLTCITFQSTVDPFDYRTLLPFSFPMMLGILYTMEKQLKTHYQSNAIWMVKGFFIFSILMNLPKHYLLGLL